MKSILTIGFIFLSATIFAQLTAPTIQWQVSLGGSSSDVAKSIQQTKDGGYIVAGYSYSNDSSVTGNHGSSDCWVAKLKKNSTVQWQKSFGGSSNDEANCIQQTQDSGYIIAGSTNSKDGDVTGNHGGDDYWIVKLTKNGAIQWQKCFGGSNNEYATSIQQTNGGGYIVSGYSFSGDGDVSGNHGREDYWIVKLTNNGTIQWQKNLGGKRQDIANSIYQTKDAGYIIAGYSDSHDGDVTVNYGTYDYWIVKLTETGIIQWQKSFGGSGKDYAESIQQTLDSGYIVAGESSSNDSDVTGNHGGSDYWIVKLDKTGTIQWQKSIGTPKIDNATSVQQTIDGGYIIAGYSNGGTYNGRYNHGRNDYWIVKLAKNGNMQWQNFYGGSYDDNAYNIEQTKDSGYIVAGLSYSNNNDVTGNYGSSDYWVVKLNKDGTKNLSQQATTLSSNIQIKNGNKNFSVYPNPAKNVLHIQLNGSAVFSLINTSGEILLTKCINGNDDINVGSLPADYYYLKNNTTGLVQKILVEK